MNKFEIGEFLKMSWGSKTMYYDKLIYKSNVFKIENVLFYLTIIPNEYV